MSFRKFKNWLLLGILSFSLLVMGYGNLNATFTGAANQTQMSTQKEESDNNPSPVFDKNHEKNSSLYSDPSETSTTGASAKNSDDNKAVIKQPISIAFWNTRQGLLVSSENGHGIVWKTTDGGHSWSIVYKSQDYLSDVVLTSNTSAKVLNGEDWKNPDLQVVTENNGQTWKICNYQKSSFSNQACSTGKFGEELFVNHSAPTLSQIWVLCDGQAAAGQMTKLIVASVDGGKTWEKRSEVGTNDSNSNGLVLNGYPQGIDFLSNGYGWLWEARGNSYYTHDGGQHWTSFSNLTSPDSKEVRSMSLLDAQHGFSLLWENNKYSLLFTEDGGQSWKKVNSWVIQ